MREDRARPVVDFAEQLGALRTAVRSSRLPAIKTLQEFDFAFQPSIRREQIASLHELAFIKRKENVIFLGPPGAGKTHCCVATTRRFIPIQLLPSAFAPSAHGTRLDLELGRRQGLHAPR